MEKDWEKRFELAEPRASLWWSAAACLAVELITSVFWALAAFGIGFEDSTGKPQNRDPTGILRISFVALLPAVLGAVGAVQLSRKRPKGARG